VQKGLGLDTTGTLTWIILYHYKFKDFKFKESLCPSGGPLCCLPWLKGLRKELSKDPAQVNKKCI